MCLIIVRVEIKNNLDYIFKLESELNKLNFLSAIAFRQFIINYNQIVANIKNKISLKNISVECQRKLLQKLILN